MKRTAKQVGGSGPVAHDSGKMLPGWERSRDAILQLGLSRNLRPLETRASNITDKWGVHWSPEFIARDLLQNFFDANRDHLHAVRVLADGTTVTVEAPTSFSLENLFYFGSTKGKGDVGEYGEGFKAAAISLLRDHGIEPVSQSGRNFVYMRLALEAIASSTMRPVLFDFFESDEPFEGARLVLRGCGSDLVKELQAGLTHFLYSGNSLLGDQLWRDYDDRATIYKSTQDSGHVFYRMLRRGQLERIPLILVLNKEYQRLETKIGSDRDRKAFGEEVLGIFYSLFAGIANHETPASIIVQHAQPCWRRGHPLLSALAGRSRPWQEPLVQRVFGGHYYAECHTRNETERLQYASIEDDWHNEGREPLPAYFSAFGVPNARTHIERINKRALEEQKRQQHRRPSETERKAIELLHGVLRDLAPQLAGIFDGPRTSYSVAETEVLLGELRRERNYYSRDVFLSAQVFVADFAQALAIFLHEHAHIFGRDGSRGFTDALTELIETVVRHRAGFDLYEESWERIRSEVVASRGAASASDGDSVERLTYANADELRAMLRQLPKPVLDRLLKPQSS